MSRFGTPPHTETAPLTLVIPHCNTPPLHQALFGRCQAIGCLLLAIFLKDLFERNGSQVPCIVCFDAVFDFVPPQSIDRLIRFVEACKELVDQTRFIDGREFQGSIKNLLGFYTHSLPSPTTSSTHPRD